MTQVADTSTSTRIYNHPKTDRSFRYPAQWPLVRKTAMMRQIERDWAEEIALETPSDVGLGPRLDIRFIILRAIAATETDREASGRIGILPPTLSHWIVKLGIDDLAKVVRTQR